MVYEHGKKVAAFFVSLFEDSDRMVTVGRQFDLAPLSFFVGRFQRNVPLFLRILRADVRYPQFHRLQKTQTFGPALYHRTQKSLTYNTFKFMSIHFITLFK